jgi:integrase
LRGYEQALRNRVFPEFGHLRVSALTRACVQDLVDRMVAEGLSASTVRNALLPLRAIYRRAVSRSEVLVNPTLGLALPAYRGRRERVARPAEAARLLEALPAGDRAVWATAVYAGLRRGELRGLRWADVDFDAGVIQVQQSWDDRVGPISPKSRAGTRRVPLAQPLRRYLAAHRLPHRDAPPRASRVYLQNCADILASGDCRAHCRADQLLGQKAPEESGFAPRTDLSRKPFRAISVRRGFESLPLRCCLVLAC